MIIQALLLFGLALAFAYAFAQRRRSRAVSFAIYAVTVCGAALVVCPGYSTDVARLMGVGRGADLVFYCWIVISLLVSINLQFRILGLQETVTRLTREIALLTAPPP